MNRTKNKDEDMSMLTQMLATQSRLNVAVAGDEWTGGFTEEGRRINWYQAAGMECVEFVDSFNWKHWKDIEVDNDIENAKLELVDIWHFLISIDISEGHDLIEWVYQHRTPKKLPDSSKGFGAVALANKFMELSFNQAGLPQNHRSDVFFLTMVDTFFKLCDSVGLIYKSGHGSEYADDNDLYSIYMGKATLNHFRTENGYKEGHYIKIWGSREDNEVMMELLAKGTPIDELSNALAKVYDEVLSAGA